MTTTYRPKWACYRITQNTPDRMVVDYNPLAYLILGGIMALLCLYAGAGSFLDGSARNGLLFTGAGLLFCGAFCGLFYHRITLNFDRPAGIVTFHSSRNGRRHKDTRPLVGLHAAFDTSFQGDRSMHRLLLIPAQGDPLRPTAALISGSSVIEASEAINAWLDSARPTP